MTRPSSIITSATSNFNSVIAFRVKPRFPRSLRKEFPLVDVVNNVDKLAETENEVLRRVAQRAAESDQKRLRRAIRAYGSERAKKFFGRALGERKYWLSNIMQFIEGATRR